VAAGDVLSVLVKEAGASGFINKPAQPAHVVAVLQQVMTGSTPWS